MSDEIRSMTINIFCRRNSIGRTKWYDLKKKNQTPRTMNVDGLERISIAAELDWQREREAASQSPEAVKAKKQLSARLAKTSRFAVAAKKQLASA